MRPPKIRWRWHSLCITLISALKEQETMTQLLKTARALSRALLGGFVLLAAASEARAVVYIYELPGGTRIVTDHVLNNKQYKLVHASRNIQGMGALMNHQNAQQILVDINGYDELIEKTARVYGMDPALVKAVVHAESGFNPHATSIKGASGLMQLMPDTAAYYGIKDVFDPRQNVRGGVLHLRRLLKKYKNDQTLALAAYNAGEDAVQRHRGVPPYEETQGYVLKVAKFKKRYAAAWRKPAKTQVATISDRKS